MNNKNFFRIIGITIFVLVLSAFVLTACNTKIILTVHYEVDGEIVHTINTDGNVISFPENPEKEGYEFDGWYFDNNTFEHRFTVGGEGAGFLTKSTTVYAKWKRLIPTVTVTFVDFNDSVIEEQTLDVGESAVAPTPQERVGYTFEGWDKSFANVVVDITVKAQYSQKQYTVTFLDSQNNVIKTTTVAHGDTAVLPELEEEEGYDIVWEGSLKIVADTTIKAKLVAKRFVVTLVDYDNSVVATETVKYGEDFQVIPTLQREGYNFLGFSGALTDIKQSDTYYAVYERIYYLVSFYNYDNSIIQTLPVAYGEDAIPPEYVAPIGYEFVGWDKDMAQIKDDLRVKVVLLHIQYTITFLDTEDNVLSEKNAYYGEKVACPTPPIVEGYEFVEWSACVDFVTKDETVYPVYAIKVLEVRIFGYDEVLLDTISVEYGEDVVLPNPPVIEGYTFREWQGNYTQIIQSEEVFAIYAVNQYNVYFVDYDNSETVVAVEHGKSATAPTPKNDREGYAFVGWRGEVTNIVKEGYVYAEYEAKTYNLSIYFEEGAVPTISRVKYDNKITLSSIQRKGYEFLGWFEDSDYTVSFTYVRMPARNLEIFAKWSNPLIYTITYDLEEGTNGQNPDNYTVCDRIVLEDASKEGYTFVCWEDEDGNCVDIIENEAKDLVLTAIYIVNSYTVTFINEGEVYEVQSIPHLYSATTPEPPTKARTAQYTYTFVRWDKDYTNITQNLIVTAEYEAQLNYYEVVFKNENQVISTQSIGYGGSATLPLGIPEKAADAQYTYVFDKWEGDYEYIEGDITIYAVYNNILNYYTVTFINNGEVYDTQSIGYGGSATLPLGTPEKAADAQYTYVFKNWQGDYSNIVGDTEINAVYNNILNYYTVTFINDGEVYDTQSIGYGHAADTPYPPTKDSTPQYTYVFSGWDKDYSSISKDTTITAQYEQNLNYYVVEFINEGEVYDTQSIGYGGSATLPLGTPEKTADAKYTYVFESWQGDYSNIVEDTLIYAVYQNVLNYYTVAFMNGNEVYDAQSIGYGGSATLPLGTPEKAADAQYTYVFDSWQGDYSNIVGETLIYAVYQNILNYYTVTFMNGSEVYDTQTIGYGGSATLPLGTPEKAADAQYTYVFIGWQGDYSNIVGNTVVQASYDNIINYYVVTFMNGNAVYNTQTIPYGGNAETPEGTPQKTADAQYTYVFKEWSGDYTNIKDNVTIYAVYNNILNYYTVTFIDYDQVFDTQSVGYGQAAEDPGTPTREGTAQYSYVFTGWNLPFNNITGDIIIAALYDIAVKSYEVKFLSYDNTVLSTQTIEYGGAAVAPQAPHRPATTVYEYEFSNWDKAFDFIVDNLIVKAVYTQSYRKYIVKFFDNNNVLIEERQIAYASTLQYTNFPTVSVASTKKVVAWKYGNGEGEHINGNITIGTQYTTSEALIKLTAIVWDRNAAYGSTTYATMEEALTAIQNYSSGTLMMKGNMQFLNNTTSSYSIPSGVTVRLPFDSAGSLTEFGDGTNGNTVNIANSSKTYLTVNIPSKVTINIYGKLEIGGIIGNKGGVRQGHTSSWHAVLMLEGTINVRANGVLDTYGFIRGSGTVETFSNGKVYEPFVISDFRGGSSTAGAYNTGKISPYNRFQLENIQTKLIVKYGAIHYGYPVLYADDKYNEAGATQMTGASGIIRLASGGELVREYESTSDANTGKLTVTVAGGATDGSLTLKVKVSVITVTVDTKTVLFPIPYNYNIILTQGTYTMSNKYKMLTGSQVTVGQGATLNVAGELIIYESFTDTTFAGAVYPTKTAGLLNILGTINVTGKFGGILRSTASGTAIMASGATLSLTSKEGYGERSGLSFNFTTTSTHTLSAQGYINNSKTSLTKGNTYTIKGGM